jgi:uncharacterized phage protein gp47/JayE
MSYIAPYIDKNGIYIPTYSQTRDYIIEQAKLIYGSDIYLEPDSMDYQFIAIVSEKIYDAFQLAVEVYNSRSPSTAVGTGLDSVVKINGIKRQASTYSTVPVTLTGIAGTVIKNGVVLDTGNIKWDLPSSVTIGTDGTASTTATCEIEGAISAAIGEITGIYNPVYGWNGVYNPVSATVGSAKEKDSALRKRQSNSTAQPSITMLEGTYGAIANVPGVTRVEVYENDTDVISTDGLPPHSITAVVEGGEVSDIAQAIFAHRGIGCYINGDISTDITDTKGQPTTIRFYRPTYVYIDLVINIRKIKNYTDSVTTSIKTALNTYLNSMSIGTDLNVSALWGTALSVMSDLKDPSFSVTSVTAARHGGTQSTSDVTIAYNESCAGDSNYITINFV